MTDTNKPNKLHYGDCLDILRKMEAESVDLIYLDPPFKSDTDYNMLFGTEQGKDMAQVRAFTDTWYWQPTLHDPLLENLMEHSGTIGVTAVSLWKMLGRCGMLAYLLFLMERLIELRRVLKSTGTIYLHCDTTAIHYIKILMDAIFGHHVYRNDITWKRATSHNDARRFGRISDRILYYTKSDDFTWNGHSVRVMRQDEAMIQAYPLKDEREYYRIGDLTGPAHESAGGESAKPWHGYDVISRGRVWSAPKTGAYAKYIEENIIPSYRDIEGVHDRLDALDEAGLITHPKKGFWPGLKRYADADTGTPMQDIILEPTGFTNYSASNNEYLGYPTQKPLDLLKPLIELSSNEGDVVLDPFCGCGTAVDAAEALGRRWIGIDISCLAIDVIIERLKGTHSDSILDKIEINGIPKDMQGAKRLFQLNKFDFEHWVVGMLLKGHPNPVQVGDKGSDGTLYFPSLDKKQQDKGIISVKGGGNVNPAMVRELIGAVETLDGQMGILVTMDNITHGMQEAANMGGVWNFFSGQTYPRIQIITVDDLLKGKRLNMPSPLPRQTRRQAHQHSKQKELV
jgi:DNA modification methylase